MRSRTGAGPADAAPGRMARRSGPATRRIVVSLVVTAGGLVLLSASAWANAPALETSAPVTGTETLNTNGTVTVQLSGMWDWVYASLEATSSHPCDTRVGGGWAIAWYDSTDPGTTLTYKGWSGSITVGSSGSNPLNTDTSVSYNASDPCGSFTATNTPAQGDGNVAGVFTGVHTYPSLSAVPQTLCAVFYDLGIPKGKSDKPSERRLGFIRNQDTSIRSQIRGTVDKPDPDLHLHAAVKPTYYPVDLSPGGPNCFSTTGFPQVPEAVTTVTTVTTTTTPTTTTTQPPATKGVTTTPSSPLAFTGTSPGIRVLGVSGALLFVMGVGLLVLFDVLRRVVLWLVRG